MLKHYGVEIFHTKAIETIEGRKRSVYKGWSKKKREEFQNEKLDLIKMVRIDVSRIPDAGDLRNVSDPRAGRYIVLKPRLNPRLGRTPYAP